MDFSIFQHQKATPKRVAFLFPKLLKIVPKAVRTRTYKGSLTGQLNIFIELSFFYDATTLLYWKKMEQCLIEKSGSNFFPVKL